MEFALRAARQILNIFDHDPLTSVISVIVSDRFDYDLRFQGHIDDQI